MTQQEMLNRLNQLTLGYNLTWQDVHYDADKAINKINNYLGTIYPSMSSVLLSPDSSYTVRVDGVDHPYFPEEYINSVVIPYIAMEVLAREEEFTTIYNKYATEVQEGLFHMFQNEFNRVPLALRQNPDQGVFFTADSALGKLAHNNLADLPVFKFRVYYHVNNDSIALGSGIQFVEDTRAYLYNDTATIKGWNIQLLSYDGVYAYQFRGWSRNKLQVTEAAIIPGATLTVLGDIHLYAMWDRINTMNIDYTGTVTIKNAYLPSLTTLIIPERINNIEVKTIASYFLHKDHSGSKETLALNLDTIVLPKYLRTIQANAFKDFKGTTIILPETPVVPGVYDGITVEDSAFADTHNLNTIIIPTNVVTIHATAFPIIVDKVMLIYIRYLFQNKPAPVFDAPDNPTVLSSGWHTEWYANTDLVTNNYQVNLIWGYNG